MKFYLDVYFLNISVIFPDQYLYDSMTALNCSLSKYIMEQCLKLLTGYELKTEYQYSICTVPVWHIMNWFCWNKINQYVIVKHITLLLSTTGIYVLSQ